RTREVELAKTIAAVKPDDPIMGIGQHTLLYRARRAVQVALAVGDAFARASELEALQQKNARAPLEGEEASTFKRLLSAVAYVAAFAFSAYLLQMVEATAESTNDIKEPNFNFDTQQDAVKSVIAGLDAALAGARDEAELAARARRFATEAIEGLLRRSEERRVGKEGRTGRGQ